MALTEKEYNRRFEKLSAEEKAALAGFNQKIIDADVKPWEPLVYIANHESSPLLYFSNCITKEAEVEKNLAFKALTKIYGKDLFKEFGFTDSGSQKKPMFSRILSWFRPQIDVNAKDIKGNALGHYIIGSKEMLEHGHKTYKFDLNTKNTSLGENVAMTPATTGRIGIVKYALEHGVNVNDVDERGNNLLHIIAINHKEKSAESGKRTGRNLEGLAEYVLKQGGDLNAKNNAGETPMQAAARKPEIADIFKKFQEEGVVEQTKNEPPPPISSKLKQALKGIKNDINPTAKAEIKRPLTSSKRTKTSTIPH